MKYTKPEAKVTVFDETVFTMKESGDAWGEGEGGGTVVTPDPGTGGQEPEEW